MVMRALQRRTDVTLRVFSRGADLSIGDGDSWGGIAQILAGLSLVERGALKAVAKGVPPTASGEALAKLNSLGLVKYNAQTRCLTDDGRAIEEWC